MTPILRAPSITIAAAQLAVCSLSPCTRNNKVPGASTTSHLTRPAWSPKIACIRSVACCTALLRVPLSPLCRPGGTGLVRSSCATALRVVKVVSATDQACLKTPSCPVVDGPAGPVPACPSLKWATANACASSSHHLEGPPQGNLAPTQARQQVHVLPPGTSVCSLPDFWHHTLCLASCAIALTCLHSPSDGGRDPPVRAQPPTVAMRR